MKKYLVIFFILFTGLSYAQHSIKTDWTKLEQVLSNTQLKEFSYKKGSLFNEAEGVSEDDEIPSAIFFPLNDPENKNKAFILAFQSIDHFKQDGIIAESKAYTFREKKTYYRETGFLQCLYVEFESNHMVVCIVFRKEALHDQVFIEKIFDELNVASFIPSVFK